jgi:hypothetical protein
MGEITDAVDKHEERKSAALGKRFDDAPIGVDADGEGVIKLLLSGLELDLDELMEQSGQVSHVAATAVLAGASHPMPVLKGVWVDGLVTGMLIVEARQKASRGIDDGTA